MIRHQFAEARSHVLVALRNVEAILMAYLPKDSGVGHVLIVAPLRTNRHVAQHVAHSGNVQAIVDCDAVYQGSVNVEDDTSIRHVRCSTWSDCLTMKITVQPACEDDAASIVDLESRPQFAEYILRWDIPRQDPGAGFDQFPAIGRQRLWAALARPNL